MMTARIIAHLRRVYRYDFAEKKSALESQIENQQESTSKIPAGWAQCQRCDYMGPREKFATEIVDGETVSVCPSCGEAEHLAYSIG
jgi:hypothetical protein